MQLGHRELDRVVVRGDRGDDTGRFLVDPPAVLLSADLDLTERLGQRVGPQQVGVVFDDLDRRFELIAVSEHAGGTDFAHQQLAQLFLVVLQRLVQLVQTVGTELGVGCPGGGIECAASSGDRSFCFVHSGVRSVAEQLTGRRIVGREGLVEHDQFAVDEQGFRHARRCSTVDYRGRPVVLR